MGSHHHLRQVEQGIVRGWFGVEDVEKGPGDVTRKDRIGKGGSLVDYATPRRVRLVNTSLASRQHLCVDQTHGLRVLGDVDRDEARDAGVGGVAGGEGEDQAGLAVDCRIAQQHRFFD